MEIFNHKSYRDNLAKKLKENPEKAREFLDQAKETDAYKNAESKYKKLRELEKEAEKRLEKYKDIIEEVNNEVAGLNIFSEDNNSEKLYLYTKKSNQNPTVDQFDVFENKYFARDYAGKYGSDYPGEFSWGQKNRYKEKLVYEKLGIFSENNQMKFLERITSVLKSEKFVPHEAFRIIEILALSGISGAFFEDLKNVVLESGNANVIRKVLEDFPITFSLEELQVALKNASGESSLFDITKIIEIAGENNVNPSFIEQRDSLLQKTKEQFLENRKIVEDGIKDGDFLLHFSGTPYLESILEKGILSNLDQVDHFSKSNSGQGNDLQGVTGRLDGVSVLDVFKGANKKEKDSQLFNEMLEKIQTLMSQFLNEKYNQNPGRIFRFSNPSRSVLMRNNKEFKLADLEEKELDSFREKYSEVVSISDMYEERIDPTEKNSDGGYHCFQINRYHGRAYVYYYVYPQTKVFKESFFKEWTEDKQELMNTIKKLMKETYVESNRDKENKKDNIIGFENQCNNWIQGAKNPALLISPSMERAFVQSTYDGESLVEGSIPPEKILGAFANNAHLERVCYNEGKIVIDYKKKEELNEVEKEDILFETPNGVIIVKNLYK